MRGRLHPGGADSASERWEGTLGGSHLLWLPRTVFVLPPTHPPTHLSSHPVIHSSILPVIHPSIHPVIHPSILSVIFIIHPSFCLVVWSLSCIQFFVTPCTAAHQASLSITNSQSLLRLMSIESVMPSNRLILCCPLLLLPSTFPSIRVFSSESVFRIRWPKYWSFSFNISPSNEHPGLISFRMDWLDLLAVQGTLKCLLQHHSSKASILWCSVFFIVQLSHLYVTTTRKTITFYGPLLEKSCLCFLICV